MAQNREAPAYQEYAATILVQMPFRIMSLQDRGLFYTMRLECWANKRLPKNTEMIAKGLGLPIDQVTESLPAVMPFFKIVGDSIICPELEDYRAHIEERKLKQSQGGKTGSTMTNDKRKANKENSDNTLANKQSNSANTLSSNSQVSPRGSNESLVQSSTEKQSQVQSSKEKDSCMNSFVAEYEEYETTEAARAHDDANELVSF